MKAITLWQPWASLVAVRAKRYETRSWKTSYRGPLAIHAAKKPISSILPLIDAYTKQLMELNLIAFSEAFALDVDADTVFGDLPLGCVVATCELGDIYPVENVYHRLYELPNESHFGDFSAGRFAWFLHNVQLVDPPIPAKGAQRLWEWEKPA